MTIILFSFLGLVCGSVLMYVGIQSGIKMTHQVEDRERKFAMDITNVVQGAEPIEQEMTSDTIEQENTQDEKGIEDIPPSNRSDIFIGV